MKRKMLGLFLVLVIMAGCLPNVVWATDYSASRIVNYVNGRVGESYTYGYCLRFVEECYQNIYGFRAWTCCAYKSGSLYIDSSSRDIPLGATVYFGGSSVSCGTCGNKAGHVGIYVGNGYFVHDWDGKVQKTTIDYIVSRGYPYRGWGWMYNTALTSGTITPPTNPKLQIYDKLVIAGNPICFEYSCNNAERMYIAIDVDGVREHFIEVSGDHYNGTFTKPGHYEAALIAYNSAGESGFSNWVSFDVYKTLPPTEPKLYMYDKLVPAGVPVCFEYSCNNAERMYIAIDVDGVREHFIEVSGDHYNGTFTKPGHYEAALIAYNSAGESGFSNWVGFDVYNSKPSNCRLVSDKLTGTTNEPIKITMSANYAINYSLHIYRNNINICNYKEIKNGKNENYVIKLAEPGTYKVYTTAYNYFDLCQSDPIYITISNPTTDYPFTVTKSGASVSITNNTSSYQNATVIIAYYDNGKLQNAITDFYKNTLFGKNETRNFSVNTIYDYKVFVWDSLEGMKPLAE